MTGCLVRNSLWAAITREMANEVSVCKRELKLQQFLIVIARELQQSYWVPRRRSTKQEMLLVGGLGGVGGTPVTSGFNSTPLFPK